MVCFLFELLKEIYRAFINVETLFKNVKTYSENLRSLSKTQKFYKFLLKLHSFVKLNKSIKISALECFYIKKITGNDKRTSFYID